MTQIFEVYEASEDVRRTRFPKSLASGSGAAVLLGAASIGLGVVVGPNVVLTTEHVIARYGTFASEGIVLEWISALSDSDIELLQPVCIHIESAGDSADGFVAHLPDVNISASGESVDDAISNIKDMLVGAFEHLNAIRFEKLGRLPRQQLSLLRSIIRRKPA